MHVPGRQPCGIDVAQTNHSNQFLIKYAPEINSDPWITLQQLATFME